ncbi:hypothetical protein N431DRAFT_327943 [Stipitochalara longipes BDJ]|nr:hypothetical protein N431DRAFT_327943 [Stipitochalara longipes BDJ]
MASKRLTPRDPVQPRSSNTEASSSTPTQQRRLGRPLLSTPPISPTDSDAIRKERIRQAQRTYRSKKENEVASLKAKVEKAERALGQTVGAFGRLQEFVVGEGRKGGVSQEVVSEVGRTGGLILGFVGGREVEEGGGSQSTGTGSQTRVSSNDVQSSEVSAVGHGTSLPDYQQVTPALYQQPSTSLLPWTHSHESLTFNQRLRLACIERGLQLLSCPDLSFSQVHPALSMHLKWMPVPQLRTLTEASLRSFPALKMYGPNPHPALPSPDLFRVVEERAGSREAVQGWQVERKHGRDVECLVFGRTRTRVETAMPGFEGEWLEARDVQEYLEEKGVLIGSQLARSELRFAVPLERVDTQLLGDAQSSRILSSSLISGSRAKEQPRTYFNGVLNLQVLIDYLALSAVCIGPGPAVRKTDVEMALMHSVARC